MAGSPLLSDEDESTKTPGLFLVGPAVRHEDHVFCFVYKFRQRFGVVAEGVGPASESLAAASCWWHTSTRARRRASTG